MQCLYHKYSKIIKEVIVNYVVYLDVFLIINTFMDFLILVIAKSLIKPRTTINRCILGAVLGGVMSVIALLIPFKIIWLRFITSYIFICLIMCKIAFKTKGIRNNVRNMCIVYIVTFSIGGAMNALYYYTTFGLVVNRILSGYYVNTLNVIRFISIALITYLITEFLLKVFMKNKASNTRLFQTRIWIKEKYVDIVALLDTGNLLCEPISGRKVHVIEYEAVKDIIEKENGFYRVIPYNSVGNSKGLLNAIEVDLIEVENEGNLPLKLEKQIIALYDKKLASDGKFEGLLHSSIKESINGY